MATHALPLATARQTQLIGRAPTIGGLLGPDWATDHPAFLLGGLAALLAVGLTARAKGSRRAGLRGSVHTVFITPRQVSNIVGPTVRI